MNIDINQNSNNNAYFDETFELAYELCGNNFSHAELVNMLKYGNIPQKQIAALKFDYVKSNDDAETLINNLTGCDGKIREAVAQKIYQLITKTPECASYFSSFGDIFADATIDINANICRFIIDSALLLSNYNDFSNTYTAKIVHFAQQSLDELDKFIYKDKKYLINKQLFKLYWCLEAIHYFYMYINNETLEMILLKCSDVSEYTIREKTANIIKASNLFPSMKSKLMNDENYYVREVFKSSTLL